DGWGWGSPRVLGLIALAIAGGVIFARRSARHAAPVIEPSLLRQPTFGVATAANVAFGMAFGAMLLLVTLWCQNVWGWSALQAGLGVAPGPLMVPLFAFLVAGRLIARFGPGRVIAVGSTIYAAGATWWTLHAGLDPNYAGQMLPGMLMTGIGVGLTLPTFMSTGASSLPPHSLP